MANREDQQFSKDRAKRQDVAAEANRRKWKEIEAILWELNQVTKEGGDYHGVIGVEITVRFGVIDHFERFERRSYRA
ncbi:MAG: hypothetical protein N2C14_08970 [Planctomycetales bacterium]